MNAAELTVVGVAAGVGAVVGALVASTHVSLVRQRWPVPLRRWPVPALLAPSVVVIDHHPIRLLQAGGAPAAGGRARVARRPGRPYDWARDGECGAA